MFLASALRTLSAVVWVGGTFFAYHVLRPVTVELLQPPQRLQLWKDGLRRLFPRLQSAIAP